MKKYYVITRFRAPYTDEEAIKAIKALPHYSKPKSHGCLIHVDGPFDTQEECEDFYWNKADTDDSAYGTYYYDTETQFYYQFYRTKNPRILGVSSNG